ncbi:MAG: hypothetical protein ACAI44_16635 [Candidatus Sericytochromatia bacterium]
MTYNTPSRLSGSIRTRLARGLTSLVLCASLTLPALAQEPDASPEPEPTPVSEASPAENPAENPSENLQPAEPSASPQQPHIGGSNITAFTRNLLGNTTVGGYFDTDFNFPQNEAAFFDQHHLILQVSSILHDRLFFNTEIEFEHGGVLGEGTNDGELRIEQAFLDYQILESLILRVGALLVPVGRLNVLHDADFRDTVGRPLFNQVIVPTTWTETGAGFYGTLSPDQNWDINYEAYVVQGLTDHFSASDGLREARPSLAADNNNAKAFTARVGASPFIGLDFGLSTYLAPFSDDAKKSLGLFAGDFSWSWGPFELLGEAGVTMHDPTPDLGGEEEEEGEADAPAGMLNGPMWGYYLEAHYHLFPDFLQNSFLGNDFERAVITLFAQFSQVDTDVSQLNEHDRTRLAVGLNYRPVTNTAFKLEYQWNIENEAILGNDPSKELANNAIVASVATGF